MTTFTAPSRPTSSERTRRSRRAFTLVEIIVSVTIGALLMATVLSVIILQAKLSTGIGNYADMNAASRQALSLFEREMRTAQSINIMEQNKVEGTFITAVTKSQLDDTTPTYEKHVITYTYDENAKTLVRSMDGKNPRVVLADIANFSLRYFNKNDAVLTNTAYAEVKKILISATLRRSVLNNTNSDYLVSAMVTMRNRIVTS